MKSAQKKGFTLIELLVAISIIAILSVIGIVAFSAAQRSARDAKRKSDLRSIKIALTLYYQATGTYPNQANPAWISSRNGQFWILDNTYFPNGTPQPPSTPASDGGYPWTDQNAYDYWFLSYSSCNPLSPGPFFALVTQLENKNDQDTIGQKGNTHWCDNTLLYGQDGWNTSVYVVTSLQ